MTTENEVTVADVSTWMERQLTDLEFKFERNDNLFSFNLGIPNCKIKCVHVDIEVVGTQIVGSAVPYLSVDEEMRARMAELIVRMNYEHLIYGCWQMDYRDGEIRYVNKVPLPTTEKGTHETLLHMLGTTLGTYGMYTDAILAVLCGAKTAEEANDMLYDPEADDDEEDEEEGVEVDEEDDVDEEEDSF